jgi:hypothetical protein
MTSGGDRDAEFDGWLSRQLHLTLDAERGPRPRPADARYGAASRTGGSRLNAIRSSMMAAVGAKAALGGAVVALAAGATAGTAATGSANPVNWGQHVVQVVQGCRQAARGGGSATGSHGIGDCVSDVAQQHGEQVRAQHSEAAEHAKASPSPTQGQRVGQQSSPSPTGNGAADASHGRGQSGPPASPGAAGSHGDGNHGHGQPTPTPTRG